MKRQQVISSNIASVGYDPPTRTLEVEFKGGDVWQYSGVAPGDHELFISAQSIGSHFHRHIKPYFIGRKVT